jgi:hypothetical protein
VNRALAVVAIALLGVALSAPGASAQASFNGPNCHGGAVSQAVPGIGAKEAAANLGLTVQQAQDLINALCANVTSNTPRCELGQGRAADQALARGDLDMWLFHLGALARCFTGESPGPPL